MFPISIPSIVRQCGLVAVWLLAFATLGVAQESVPFGDERDQDGPGSTESQAGNFVVKGPDAFTRGVYAEFGESTFKEFQRLMKLGGRLKYPIVLDLRKIPGNRVRGHPVKPLAILSPKYSPNIQIALCESFRFEYLREDMVKFFLMDYALRGKPRVDQLIEKREKDGSSMVPNWLWAGVSEAISFRENGEPTELFSAVFQAGNILSVDEILNADSEDMNTLSRAIYRASAGGLVMTLLDQSGGTERMRNFMGALAVAPPDQEALVRKYFPAAGTSQHSLEKWWLLKAAELAKPTSLDVLSIMGTEEQLRRAVVVAVMEDVVDRATGLEEPRDEPRRKRRLRIFRKKRDDGETPDGEGAETLGSGAANEFIAQRRATYGLSEYAKFSNRGDLEDILGNSKARLTQLSFRCFPLHRPLIKSYLELIEKIEAGETKGIDARFAKLAETRAGLLRSGKMAEDVMNLLEATEPGEDSGAFDEYFKLFDRLRLEKPEREDEISEYLDRVQGQVK